MSEASEQYHDSKLAAVRLLTESNHFLANIDADGNVPDAVFEAVVQNRTTAAVEIGMPGAVTTVEHEVTHDVDAAGRRKQIIWWLGNTAVEVAESGHKFHFSAPAFKRVDVEVSAASFDQDRLRPGMAQPFVSPGMTERDASKELAKAEHLYGDDSLRISTAITNNLGEVVGRKLQCLLVKGVPLNAWMKMMHDPNNIFGKVIPVRDERSALSVMEQFAEMELPESAVPNGPITLVEAVLPYITDDPIAYLQVENQIEGFYKDQELYAVEAARAGRDWASFDLELARSIRNGWATDNLRTFILQNNDAWLEESRSIIDEHHAGNSQYSMSTELAALLARAKQKLLGDQIAVITKNEAAISDVSSEDRQEIVENHEALVMARDLQLDPQYIHQLEWRQYELLHRQSIRSGGGCPGTVAAPFGSVPEPGSGGVGEDANPFIPQDRLGSRLFTCPKGHENFRTIPNVPEKVCRTCNIDVSCAAPKLPKPKHEIYKRKTTKPLARRTGRAALATVR